MQNRQPDQNENADPPYKCARTIETDVCLKFYRNPANGLYDLPPGGERVDCTECQYFFA